MINKYIEDLASALQSPGARALYFPMDKAERERGNLRLARELGYGLARETDHDISSYAGCLYGSLLVRNSLDSVGVMLDNATWLAAIRAGIASEREAITRRNAERARA